MNIIFVSKECPPSLRSYGIGTYVWETGRALAHIGHNVTIIAASDDGHLTSSTPSPRMTIIRLPDDELIAEKRNIIARTLHAPVDQGIAYRRRVADCISNVIDEHHPDIVEFPGFRGESAIWLEGGRLVPMAVRMHGITAGVDASWKDHLSATRRLKLEWERKEFKAADVITVVSEHPASAVRARFGAQRVQVVHNSIDSDHWRELSVEAPQGLEHNDILYVGSLVRNKGIFILLQASRIMREKGWRGRLVLVGRTSGEFERFVRVRAFLGWKLPEWVVHFGMYERDRLAGLYRDAAVCCFPSLREALSYTCMEAMACGGLVVGSLRTGMAEILTETCGLLVPPGNIHSLVAALTSALSMGAEERKRMKDAAWQRIQTRFDHSVIIPELVSIYERAISFYRAEC